MPDSFMGKYWREVGVGLSLLGSILGFGKVQVIHGQKIKKNCRAAEKLDDRVKTIEKAGYLPRGEHEAERIGRENKIDARLKDIQNAQSQVLTGLATLVERTEHQGAEIGELFKKVDALAERRVGSMPVDNDRRSA